MLNLHLGREGQVCQGVGMYFRKRSAIRPGRTSALDK